MTPDIRERQHFEAPSRDQQREAIFRLANGDMYRCHYGWLAAWSLHDWSLRVRDEIEYIGGQK